MPKIRKSIPNVEAAFQICEEIVNGVLAQTDNGKHLETLDTANLAHLMAAVQLMTMRGINENDIHILLESLCKMLVSRDSAGSLPQVGDGGTEPEGVKH